MVSRRCRVFKKGPQRIIGPCGVDNHCAYWGSVLCSTHILQDGSMKMKKVQLIGIERLLKEKRKLDVRDVAKAHYRLLREYPMPVVEIDSIEECKPGSSVNIRIRDMPAPAVDVFKGKITKDAENDLDLPIYLSFRTTTGITLKPLLCEKEDQYTVVIPGNITNGLIGIIFPIHETFGPKEIRENYPEDVQRWINKNKHISRTSLTKDDCPIPPLSPKDFRYLTMIYPKPFLSEFHFVIGTCPICPYGAIKVTRNSCFVDPLICRGQKYSYPPRNEEICWNCFNPTDGTISTKCDYVTLRKVFHINPDPPKKEVPCCGACIIGDLCSQGAIDNSYGFFSADKQKCNGCMECYYGKNCPWNCGINCSPDCVQWDIHESVTLQAADGGGYQKNVHYNYTMRMVSHIDEKSKLVLSKLVLRLEDFWWRSPYDWYFDRDDFDFDSDEASFELYLWGDKFEKIPIKLDKNGVQNLKLKEVPFTRSIHLGLFKKDGKLFGFSHCGSNIPIRSLGGKRYSDPTIMMNGGTFDFDSPIGKIQIEYLIK